VRLSPGSGDSVGHADYSKSWSQPSFGITAMLPSLTFLLLLTHHALPAKAVQYTRRANNSDVLDFVNPLIGSQQGGNVFAGAVCAWIKLSKLSNSTQLTLVDFALWHGKG